MNLVSAFLLLGAATAAALPRTAPSISVQLAHIADTQVRAIITNTGPHPLRLLQRGTLLDPHPVRKVDVHTADGTKLPFHGIHKRVHLGALEPTAFAAPLAPGSSLTVPIDIALEHDLSAPTGPLRLSASGSLPFALSSSPDAAVAGHVHFHSNELPLLAAVIDSARAAAAHETFKRSLVADCAGAQQSSARGAEDNCASFAAAAQQAALSGDANKFAEYFGTTGSTVRRLVSSRFAAVAAECRASPGGGVTSTHCVDQNGYCSSGTLAYTMPAQNIIVDCPLYFSALPMVSGSCHGQDMSTTTVHESTHATGVFAPGTLDYAYGYDGIQGLSVNQRVNNADTYALYANAIHLGC